MKLLPTVAIVSVVLASAGCSTLMPTEKTGFLSSYDGMAFSQDAGSSSVRVPERLNPARITIANVDWRVKAGTNVSAREQERLLTELRSDLQTQISQMPASPEGRGAVLHAAITDIATVSPLLNLALAAAVLLPLDRGGAAVELEAIDVDSNKQIAALSIGYFAPLSDLGARFSRLAPAKIAEQKAAKDFVALLQP